MNMKMKRLLALEIRAKELEPPTKEKCFSREDYELAFEARKAYYFGLGPKPPDEPRPSRYSPERWEIELKAQECSERWMYGLLKDGEYIPGLSDEEKLAADVEIQILKDMFQLMRENPGAFEIKIPGCNG